MDPDQSAEKENAAFQQAMIVAGSEFLEVIYYMVLNSICFQIAVNSFLLW